MSYQGMYKTQPGIVLEARPYGIKFAQEIAEIANRKGPEGAVQFGALIAALVLQNIITSVLTEKYEPGSAEGEAALREMYDSVLKDALDRWQAPDLKKWFTHNKKGQQ